MSGWPHQTLLTRMIWILTITIIMAIVIMSRICWRFKEQLREEREAVQLEVGMVARQKKMTTTKRRIFLEMERKIKKKKDARVHDLVDLDDQE